MRLLALAILALLAAGCMDAAKPAQDPSPSRRSVAGERPRLGAGGPVTLEELEYSAPAIAGPWMAAFWIQSDATRQCQATFARDMRTSGGIADTILMVAQGWARPEVRGRIQHDYSRGDGFLLHASVPGANHTVKGPTGVGAPSMAGNNSFRVDLPTVAFIAIGNSYMHNGNRPSLALRLVCDGSFVLMHHVDGPNLRIYGPEDFDGFVLDTAGGFGAQRDAHRTVTARDGLIALLHEDANQGNAQYTTTKPDGSQQVDTLGNRIAVGPAGLWRFGLNRASLSPGGEFRLFAFDVPVPVLDEPKAPGPPA